MTYSKTSTAMEINTSYKHINNVINYYYPYKFN